MQGTVRAFCLHKGNWQTKKAGRQDWNKEMLQKLVEDVASNIRKWDDLSTLLIEALEKPVEKIFGELHSQLAGNLAPALMALT